MIITIIIFASAAFCLVLSVRSFRQKGFLLNSAYLFATKEERKAIVWKPYYIRSGVAFLSASIIFALIGIGVLLRHESIFYVVLIIGVAVVVYAIVSAVVIEKNIKTKYQK